MQNLVYFLYEKAYINITNACTNRCRFCVRDIKDDVKGANLWLEDEKVAFNSVVSEIEKNKDKIKIHNEITFCGYGEPLCKYNEVIRICRYIKEKMPEVKIRINTNGHGNYIAKENIVPKLFGLVDSISISLNGQNEEVYNNISRPIIKNAYGEMLNFAQECVKCGIDTTLSIVVGFDDSVDSVECEKIANKIGAKFREREWIKNGY